MALILKIVDRAMALCDANGVRSVKPMDVLMALTLVNDRTPLRLEALLHADDLNFTHDVFGILRHIDTETGALRDCFCPRFTAYAPRFAP